jgi:hypothetical protein
MPADNQNVAELIRSELASTRTSFYTLLDSLSEDDFHRQSLNPGWTNGEILAHMLFGFIVVSVLLPMVRVWGRLPQGSSKPFAWLLNAFTGPFNWFNALGARMQGKVLTHERIGKLYDRVYNALLNKVASIQDEEWSHGMYFPARWDPNFSDYMTIEELFHYPVNHFNFHLKQISPQPTTSTDADR